MIPSAGIAIFKKELFSEPLPLGTIFRVSSCGVSEKSIWMTGTWMPDEEWLFSRVSGWTTEERNGCSRVARFATGANGLFERISIHLDTLADGHIVDGYAGILAEQVVVALGHLDIGYHGAEHLPGGGAAFALAELVEALLDVGGQALEGPDVELPGGLFDRVQINLHGVFSCNGGV